MTKWQFNENISGDVREDNTYLVKVGPQLWSDDFIAKPDVDFNEYIDCASELIKEHIDKRIKDETIKCEYLWKHEEPESGYTKKAYKKCEIDVNVIDEGAYGHRIEITADDDFHGKDVLSDILKWLREPKNNEKIEDILNEQMCEAMGFPNGWFCHFDGKQDYDAMLEEGYCLDKHNEAAINIEDASPEELADHIKETSKPTHYERKFLLTVIKGA